MFEEKVVLYIYFYVRRKKSDSEVEKTSHSCLLRLEMNPEVLTWCYEVFQLMVAANHS